MRERLRSVRFRHASHKGPCSDPSGYRIVPLSNRIDFISVISFYNQNNDERINNENIDLVDYGCDS